MTRSKRDALEALRGSLAALDALEAQRAALRQDLARALALGVLWPGLWDSPGPARARWVRRGSVLEYLVTGPTGETRVFPWADVPDVLREPDALRRARP